MSFFLLAPYIAIEATRQLLTGSEPKASWLGIALALSSIVFMPLFGYAKKRIGNELARQRRRARGRRTSCVRTSPSRSSSGLAANALLGWWWADPLVALLVAVVAVQAGLRTWRGEGCDSAC